MDGDGTKAGYDLALTRTIADAVSVPVIASGGVGTLDHLVEGIRDGHAGAVLAASIFHFGTFTIGEAKAHLAAAGVPVGWGTRLVDMVDESRGVTALLRRADGVMSVRARWIVGADGARSLVRRLLDVPFEAIAARLGVKAIDRPLFRSLEEARALYEERRASYRLSDTILALEGDEGVDAVVDRIVEALESRGVG